MNGAKEVKVPFGIELVSIKFTNSRSSLMWFQSKDISLERKLNLDSTKSKVKKNYKQYLV